ncbi:MAG: T9SS type A sorting domain-containing protein [Bacteroidetes bacterium]|nr:T9SS type A sorting domain-containing protein [Bacteroidota bacterium]
MYLDLSGLNAGTIQQCYITDFSGRIITNIQVDDSIVIWNNTLASGIYLLHLIASDGTQYTHKIIRN